MEKMFVIIKKIESEYYEYEASLLKVSVDKFVAQSGFSIETVLGAIRHQCERNNIHCAHNGNDLYDSSVSEYIFRGNDLEAFKNSLFVLKPLFFDIKIINN